jgi:hypothetical protein
MLDETEGANMQSAHRGAARRAKILGGMLAVAATTAVVVAPPSASAASCYTYGRSDSFGHANITRCGSYVYGTVYDDKADGHCVYYWVYFHKPEGYQELYFSGNACPKGDSTSFYIDAGAGAWMASDGISHT